MASSMPSKISKTPRQGVQEIRPNFISDFVGKGVDVTVGVLVAVVVKKMDAVKVAETVREADGRASAGLVCKGVRVALISGGKPGAKVGCGPAAVVRLGSGVGVVAGGGSASRSAASS